MICCLSPIFANCMEKENTADEDLVGDWFKHITGLGDLNTCVFILHGLQRNGLYTKRGKRVYPREENEISGKGSC